ncbi:hypothetical protein HN358_03820 [Candidatus Uhrbacteria bacterium]|nr:hypothetical protein [Candidatus Uhrbacteria bacterium]MBT7717653.1 hypothetical protein [Candidatus Uhrbacteria bacterium]
MGKILQFPKRESMLGPGQESALAEDRVNAQSPEPGEDKGGEVVHLDDYRKSLEEGDVRYDAGPVAQSKQDVASEDMDKFSSNWAERDEIVKKLASLQKGSKSQKKRNVAMQRKGMKNGDTEHLINSFANSSQEDWVSKPIYFQALIEELEERGYQG